MAEAVEIARLNQRVAGFFRTLTNAQEAERAARKQRVMARREYWHALHEWAAATYGPLAVAPEPPAPPRGGGVGGA